MLQASVSGVFRRSRAQPVAPDLRPPYRYLRRTVGNTPRAQTKTANVLARAAVRSWLNIHTSERSGISRMCIPALDGDGQRALVRIEAKAAGLKTDYCGRGPGPVGPDHEFRAFKALHTGPAPEQDGWAHAQGSSDGLALAASTSGEPISSVPRWVVRCRAEVHRQCSRG